MRAMALAAVVALAPVGAFGVVGCDSPPSDEDGTRAVRSSPSLDDGLAAWERGDFRRALEELRPLAEQGEAEAQVKLGEMYMMALGLPQDDAEAASWYRKAAEQGHAEAQVQLGLMYDQGDGVRQDYAEAASWYRKAAEQGHARGQLFLGFSYDQGHGVLQDYAEAASWYRKAAEQGHAEAQFQLGRMYDQGHGVPRDHVAAHMWLNIAAADGWERATEVRQFLAVRMTTAEVSEAQRRARVCLESGYEVCD